MRKGRFVRKLAGGFFYILGKCVLLYKKRSAKIAVRRKRLVHRFLLHSMHSEFNEDEDHRSRDKQGDGSVGLTFPYS